MMLEPGTKSEGTPLQDLTRDDADLVRRCLQGDEASWSILVSKYKNLIFSIPINYGFSPEDAADIFQSVCLDLVHGLAQLRDSKALAGWLIRVTHNKCFHQRKDSMRFAASDIDILELSSGVRDIQETRVRELEQEQILRAAIRSLTPRCQQLVEILFYESPPRPYKEVAESLGLATGSIGFIRSRCLDKLGKKLEEMGFSESDA
jgi:RNA polymerase sigma factor (sigma-70 family)